MRLKSNHIKIVKSLAILAMAGGMQSGLTSSACAQAIELQLLEDVPVPTPRPYNGVANAGSFSASVSADAQTVSSIDPTLYAENDVTPVSGLQPNKISAIKGSLKDGLGGLAKKDATRARAILAGMQAGSLDRKILAWSIATSGLDGITSGEISQIAAGLPDWPGQATMRINAEAALRGENLGARQIISVFGSRKPESVEGAIQLATANIALGDIKTAHSVIAPFWHSEKLSEKEEKEILDKVGKALTVSDHRFRMHKQFYKDRAMSANRIASYAEQSSLAKARTALIQGPSNALKAINNVAPSSQKDAAYLFAQIEYARKNDNFKEAAKLLRKAPSDELSQVDPHEWWVERRIVSRGLLDQGDARGAYEVAANHSAVASTDRSEAEFHAGWYAVRFLNDAAKARKHFAKILEISSTPISQARAYYWLGRASSGSTATQYYRAAAQHSGTFYGQLAAQKIGVGKLKITNPRPSTAERSNFATRELVRAIERLESIGYDNLTGNFYYALAESLNSPGEIALLSARAEKQGNPSLALRIGKLAYQRGFDVDTLAWPIGAIPTSAKIGNTGLALAYSIARQESEFNKGAVSPSNARGLLQLLPGTAKEMARASGLKYSYGRLTGDAGYNATLGAAYLSKQLDDFDNSYILTVAGYNAGPRRSREWVERYGDPRGKSIDFVVDWIELIPFTETRNYVQRVMENYTVYKTRIANAKLDLERDLRFGRK